MASHRPSRKAVALAAATVLSPLILGIHTGASLAQLPAETWFVIHMGEKAIGSGVTRAEPGDNGAPVQLSQQLQLDFVRFGQAIRQRVHTSSTETAAGEVLAFSWTVEDGQSKTITEGRRRGDRLEVVTRVGGDTPSGAKHWEAESSCRGFFAVEQSLQQQPLRAGDRRRFQMLMPVVGGVANVDLLATEWESTTLLAGQRKLLRVVVRTTLEQGSVLENELWTDEHGRILKQRFGALDQTTFVTDRATATGAKQGWEIGVDSLLPLQLNDQLPAPHRLTQASYRVHSDVRSIRDAFANTYYQHVSRDEGASIVTVGPFQRTSPNAPAPEQPAAHFTEPTAYIESDAVEIRAMANVVQPGLDDPELLVAALAQHVYRWIAEKDYTRGFASALEVARNPRGDCTEHAVLLTALCRARGIPARTVVGLVYVPDRKAMAPHMWTKVWVDGRWMPVDATRGDQHVGPGHLELAAGREQQSGLTAILPVLQLMNSGMRLELLAGSHEGGALENRELTYRGLRPLPVTPR